MATLPPMLWPSRSIGARARPNSCVEDELEVAEVLGEEVGVGGRRVARAEAAPVEREHVAVLGEGVDDELERCGDVHPAVQHDERRPVVAGQRRVAPFEQVLAQAARRHEEAARAAGAGDTVGVLIASLYAARGGSAVGAVTGEARLRDAGRRCAACEAR